MPGHSASKGFPRYLKKNLALLDTTELPVTDDINHPAGPAVLAMDLAARAFGAGLTRFITTGATTAIHIMLACAVSPGDKILVTRCTHQSVLNAAALLDLDIIWYQPENMPIVTGTADRTENEKFSLLYQPRADLIDSCLQNNPACKAVVITSPDYYGQCADVRQIAETVHRHKAVLLVDEAHGSHLAFAAEYLPASSMCSGADMCVQSGHKTLPVLTQGAWLHVSSRALQEQVIDKERLNAQIPIYQTSSPSFAIAATLDYARACMERNGNELICRQLRFVSMLGKKLDRKLLCTSNMTGSGPDNYRDPLRVVITSRSAGAVFPAREIAGQLAAVGCNIEFADLTRMVLLPSLFKTGRDWRRLGKAINSCIAQIRPDSQRKLLYVEKLWRMWLAVKPEPRIPLREMLLYRQNITLKPGDEAEGKILARAVTPYPPGIPLYYPGEILDREKLDFLRLLLENDINIAGIDQEKIPVIV